MARTCDEVRRPLGMQSTMRTLATAALVSACCAFVGGASAATRPAPLAVTIAGSGTVSVYGSGSLACEDACDATLKWTGACRGTRVTCFVQSGVGAHVQAFFSPNAVPPPAAPASSVRVLCTVPDHAAAGSKGVLTVKPSSQ